MAQERTLEAVSCKTRRCENPVLGACEFYKASILLDSIFKKSTLHTVSDVVRLGCGTSVRLQLGVASTTEKKLSVIGTTFSRAKPARRNKVANSCSVRSLPP